jgi:hypothetical protein
VDNQPEKINHSPGWLQAENMPHRSTLHDEMIQGRSLLPSPGEEGQGVRYALNF